MMTTGLPTGTAVAACAGMLALRSASEADRDFLQAVFFSVRAEEFINAGWSLAEIEPLLQEQFSIQDRYYRRHYPDACFDLVTLDGKPIGRLYHRWSADEVQIIDIALLPQHRGAGIGSRLMHALVASASRRDLSMRLYVEIDNPVRSLYRRLGFVSCEQNGIYDLMRRKRSTFAEVGDAPLIPGLQDLLQPCLREAQTE